MLPESVGVGNMSSKKLLSNAGKYLVAARLTLMGYVVRITEEEAPVADIEVRDPEKGRSSLIKVKTTKEEVVLLGVEATRENLDEKLDRKITRPHVIVHLTDKLDIARFYIVPAKDLKELAKRGYLAWLRRGRKYLWKTKEEQEKHERTPQPLSVPIKKLRKYLEKWENIWT